MEDEMQGNDGGGGRCRLWIEEREEWIVRNGDEIFRWFKVRALLTFSVDKLCSEMKCNKFIQMIIFLTEFIFMIVQ